MKMEGMNLTLITIAAPLGLKRAPPPEGRDLHGSFKATCS